MAALVQSYQQQPGSVTMLQTRPSSASGILQNTTQSQGHHQFASGTTQGHRNSYHNLGGGSGSNTYRGHTSMTPVAPYAFTSTPSLTGFRPPQAPYLLANQRTTSAPTIPTIRGPEPGQGVNRARYPAAASISTTSSSSSSDRSSGQKSGTRDDSTIPSQTWTSTTTRAPRPHSTIFTSSSVQPHLAPPPSTAAKISPERYRRPANRRASSSASSQQLSATASPVNQLYSLPSQLTNFQPMSGFQSYISQIPQTTSGSQEFNGPSRSATDDLIVQRQPNREDAGRNRRRSIHTIDVARGDLKYQQGFPAGAQMHPLRSFPVNRPASSPERNGSKESITSRNSNSRPPSATKREPSAFLATTNPAPVSAGDAPLKYDQPQLVNIPPRGSSSDVAKRIPNPSPLSKPMTMNSGPSATKDSFASAVNAALQTTPPATQPQAATGNRPQSPAAKQLAALNDKEGKKSKSSRLRRAFSFGSAAELRKVTGEASTPNATATAAEAVDKSQLRKERFQDEQDAEQARIAQKQEEGGIGSGIYSGQGRIFSGSTDNLSISSTASSASIMIRKMGKGMKKSTRSLVGLFRPKSVIGVPAVDSRVPEPSYAQVSMVTVEAERERVNVNASPSEQIGGGTGFPKLERNSLDAVTSTAATHGATNSVDGGSASDVSRRSIHGGERERAEVLAAVKKGILKRSGTESGSSSPTVRAVDNKAPNFNLPQIPNVNDSPSSTAPSTPNEEHQGHRRTGSVTLGGEDYFMSALKFHVDSKSVPNTPLGTLKRNATFSPRIQFHDTWPSGEYDRRGEIATCNRLTPMLAQQIKEELNTFKMEMEVHENSKIYTHFF